MNASQPTQGNETTRCAIGLDVGGTKTAGGIVTNDGEIVMHHTIPTLPQRGGEAVARDVYCLAEQLMESGDVATLKPSGIGISLCELVSNSGEVVSDATIKWRNLDIRQMFSQLAPTVLEADSRAAALCEAQFGAGKPYPIFLYVTIGTGIGCCLIVDGRPYRGARGITGTMASGRNTTLCPECSRTSSTIIEHIASGPAIAMQYNQRTGASVAGSEAVLAAADAGEQVAHDVIRSAAECLGSAIAQLVSVLDPHAVVVGGGLGTAAGLYWELLQQAISGHVWSDAHRKLPIVQGEFGGLAGVAGAAVALQQSIGDSTNDANKPH